MPNSGDKPRIVFFGNERLATGLATQTPILRMLTEEGYDIAAIVINSAETRSRNERQIEIAQLAKKHDIPVYSPSNLNDMLGDLESLKADVGILVAYGKMVPGAVIRLFPHGIINVHPSLLPKHRGSIPIESVLLSGEKETGVSLMELAPAMDTGAIYSQSGTPTDDKTKLELVTELADIGAAMLRELLPGILEGTIVAMPQDHSAATYDDRIDKTVSSAIDPTKPAELLAREVRAYAGWPGSHLEIAGKDIIIIAAHTSYNSLENVDNKTIFVADKQLCLQTSDGVLVIDTLKPAGKKEMTAQAFLAGYGKNI